MQILKITKDKVKLFFVLLFSIFLLSYLSPILISIVVGKFRISRQAQVNLSQTSIEVLKILTLFFVPYTLVAFFKKSFSFKRDFSEFTKAFFIFYITQGIVSIIPFLLYKILPSKIYFSNTISFIALILQILAYYIAICFIINEK